MLSSQQPSPPAPARQPASEGRRQGRLSPDTVRVPAGSPPRRRQALPPVRPFRKAAPRSPELGRVREKARPPRPGSRDAATPRRAAPAELSPSCVEEEPPCAAMRRGWGRGREAAATTAGKGGGRGAESAQPGGDFGGAHTPGRDRGSVGRWRRRRWRRRGRRSGGGAAGVAARGRVGAGGGFRGGRSRRHFGSFESTIKDRGCGAGVASVVGLGPEPRGVVGEAMWSGSAGP